MRMVFQLVASRSGTAAPGQHSARAWTATRILALDWGLKLQLCMRWLPMDPASSRGAFNHAGGNLAPEIARWNGTTWSGFGLGTIPTGEVLTLAVSGTDLFAGGKASQTL